jgi:hypothetical protein
MLSLRAQTGLPFYRTSGPDAVRQKPHSLVTWNVLNSFGTNAGITTTLVYDVQYSSCRVSEKMTLFKPSGGKIQIQGHFLNPKSGIQNDKGDSQPTLKT